MEHRGRPLPLHLVNEARRLRREGLSVRDIVRATGLSNQTVQNCVKGLPSPHTARAADLQDQGDTEPYGAEEPQDDGLEDLLDQLGGVD